MIFKGPNRIMCRESALETQIVLHIWGVAMSVNIHPEVGSKVVEEAGERQQVPQTHCFCFPHIVPLAKECHIHIMTNTGYL